MASSASSLSLFLHHFVYSLILYPEEGATSFYDYSLRVDQYSVHSGPRFLPVSGPRWGRLNLVEFNFFFNWCYP